MTLPNDDPTAETSTWAKHQPTTIGIQQARKRQYCPKTHAERQTENMRRERIKENAEALQMEVKAFHNMRDKMVKDLALKFRKKEAYIRVLLCSSSTLKTTRKPNLKNAILHKKAIELNEGLSFYNLMFLLPYSGTTHRPGRRKPIEAGRSSKDDRHREDNGGNDGAGQERPFAGARRSPRAQAQRRKGIKLIYCARYAVHYATPVAGGMSIVFFHSFDLTDEHKADNLASRTGAHAFVFVTRGHVQDLGVPGWIATEGTESFFSDVLKTEAWSVLRKFEHWACSSDKCMPPAIFTLYFCFLTIKFRRTEGRFMAGLAYTMQ